MKARRRLAALAVLLALAGAFALPSPAWAQGKKQPKRQTLSDRIGDLEKLFRELQAEAARQQEQIEEQRQRIEELQTRTGDLADQLKPGPSGTDEQQAGDGEEEQAVGEGGQAFIDAWTSAWAWTPPGLPTTDDPDEPVTPGTPLPGQPQQPDDDLTPEWDRPVIIVGGNSDDDGSDGGDAFDLGIGLGPSIVVTTPSQTLENELGQLPGFTDDRRTIFDQTDVPGEEGGLGTPGESGIVLREGDDRGVQDSGTVLRYGDPLDPLSSGTVLREEPEGPLEVGAVDRIGAGVGAGAYVLPTVPDDGPAPGDTTPVPDTRA